MAFAVHGTAELAFTGAAAGLLIAGDAVAGALVGSLVVATAFGLLGGASASATPRSGSSWRSVSGSACSCYPTTTASPPRRRTSCSARSSASAPARSIVLVAVAVACSSLAVMYRPLLFASVDPEVAEARGVPTRLVGVALPLRARAHGHRGGADRRHAAGAQPGHHAGRRGAAAHRPARRWSPACRCCSRSSAADGGLLASLRDHNVKASVFVTAISFGSTWWPGPSPRCCTSDGPPLRRPGGGCAAARDGARGPDSGRFAP